jgi:hypothetical protein
MRRIRLWVACGSALVASWALFMAGMLPGSDFTTAGPVWGCVSYQGHRLTSGAVLFFPMEKGRGDWKIASILPNGTYSIGARWNERGPGKSRYKICVVPDGRQLAPAWKESPSARAIPASLDAESAAPRPAADETAFPRRFCEIETSNLEVSLGREPARIDIDLKD